MTGVAFVPACVCRELRKDVGKHTGPVFLPGVVLGPWWSISPSRTQHPGKIRAHFVTRSLGVLARVPPLLVLDFPDSCNLAVGETAP